MTAARTIEEVRHVYRTGRTRSLTWRLSQLAALQQLLEHHQTEIESALHADLGKTGFEAWVSEIGQVLSEIRWLRKQVTKWAAPEKVRTPLSLLPATSTVQHVPRGTVLVISPWNYPVLLSLSPLAGAIATGNAVVLKPSEVATEVEKILLSLIGQYLDPHAVRVVTGGPETVHEMLEARPDYVFFTGSPRVGAIIATECAARHIDYTLELGGQSPVYVHEDANLAVTARRLVWGKFFNTGQTCVAPNHVYVHERIADALRDAILAEIPRQFGTDHATDPNYPRMITPQHTASVAELLTGTRGNIVYGGTVNIARRYIEPTVVTQVAEDDMLMSREIFGPILPLLTVTGLDDALERISHRPHPLAAYLFTESAQLKERFSQGIVAGGLGINIPVLHVGNPHLPFGGVGASGTGQYHGRWSLETFTQQRAVLDKPTRVDTIRLITHPVAGWANTAVRRLLTGGRNPRGHRRAARRYRTQQPTA